MQTLLFINLGLLTLQLLIGLFLTCRRRYFRKMYSPLSEIQDMIWDVKNNQRETLVIAHKLKKQFRTKKTKK